MNILSAKINWNANYMNFPDLEIEVDEMPDTKTMRYEERNNIFYAEREGYASYFYYKEPGEGFGGREFPITMKDGTEKILKGPWSSRASCVNQMGFGPVVDIVLSKNQYYRVSGAVTLRIAQKAIKMIPNVFLILHKTNSGDIIFTPSLEAGRITKYNQYNGFSYYDENGTLLAIPKLGA